MPRADADIEGIDFHHVTPTEKKFKLTVTELGRRPRVDVLAEAAKCVLLCARCHRVHHAHETAERMAA